MDAVTKAYIDKAVKAACVAFRAEVSPVLTELPLLKHRVTEVEEVAERNSKILLGNGKLGIVAKVLIMVGGISFVMGILGSVIAASIITQFAK